MPKLKRQQFDVLLDDGTEDGVEHRVTVIHGDIIRGHSMARGRKLHDDVMAFNSMCVWQAMKRQELTALSWTDWCENVLNLQEVADVAGNPVPVEPDPTPASIG